MPTAWQLPIAAAAFCVVLFSAGYLVAVFATSPTQPPIVVEKNADNESYSTLKSETPQGEELLGQTQTPSKGAVVASINSDKYHLLHCPGAKQIKDENKIYFPSVQEAQLAGFVLAGNCK